MLILTWNCCRIQPQPHPGVEGNVAVPVSPAFSLEYFHARERQLLTLMTSKQWMLIALAIALGGFSLYLNKDWFARDNIQITHRSRPARVEFMRGKRPAEIADVNPIIFGFDRQLKLTSLKVISRQRNRDE